MKAEDRNKFLYETSKLKPFQRKEMIYNFMEKAKALCEQELIMDNLYNQMDFKTMGILEKERYKDIINKLDKLLEQ